MSAQTGEPAPSAPASRRLVDRARYRFARMRTDPNPIWIRELKQAARLPRTPAFLMLTTIVMALLIASVGGSSVVGHDPAAAGAALFQVFFSAAYFVVALVGPAVAANGIASEREGGTWEAVLLTGLGPGVVAQGKFLAAMTAVGMYLTALAPVAAMSFLFGGVTATQVVLAFAFLILVSALGVAFGLAISSKMETPRGAIVVTLLMAFPLASFAYLTFGFGLSYGAHALWAGVPDGAPIWLPIAYERAPFDLRYAALLLGAPLLLVALPAWFLYEVTIANLTSASDDRSNGLKRWFVVTTVALTSTAVAALRIEDVETAILGACGIGALLMLLQFGAILFQGEQVGPSRRVLVEWERQRAGKLRRFFGPGTARTAALLTGAAVASIGVVTGATIAVVRSSPASVPGAASAIAAFAGYALGFFGFVVGLAAYARVRFPALAIARALTAATVLAFAVGPLIVAALTGAFVQSNPARLVLASPSPLYAIGMMSALLYPVSTAAPVVPGVVCSVGWAIAGVVLFTLARRSADRLLREHASALAESERVFAEEDAARDAAAGSEAE